MAASLQMPDAGPQPERFKGEKQEGTGPGIRDMTLTNFSGV
jgi:hypothetical protein